MKDKILIYFPDTGGYNLTPPYEVLFQLNALVKFKEKIIIIDARYNSDEKQIKVLLENTAIVIISTIIKYTSITINFQVKDGILFSERVAEAGVPVIWTGMAACLLDENIKRSCCNDIILKSTYEGDLIKIINKTLNVSESKQLASITNNVNNQKILRPSSFEDFGDFSFKNINVSNYIHNNTFDYIASTGCINSCSFCSVPAIYKQHWTHNKVEHIVTHLKDILTNNENIKVIHFRDDNFTINKSFIFSLFEKLDSEKIKFLWSCQTSVNVLRTYKDEELVRLYNYGCRNISLGIESGDDFILEKTTKSKTSKIKAIELINRLKDSGITISVTSIISFHYNQGRDYIKTLRFLMKLKLLHPQLSMYCTVFQPIPGTEIFKEIFNDQKYSLELLENNTWTSKQRKAKLKKYESFYFIFDNKNFYKQLPTKYASKLKLINIFFSPLIKLRFRLGVTGFLWEYALTSWIIKKVKNEYGIKTDSTLSDVGIRHLTSNYEYGFKRGSKKT